MFIFYAIIGYHVLCYALALLGVDFRKGSGREDGGPQDLGI